MAYAIEEIRIPFIWDPPPISCRFVRWLIRDGEHVFQCQGIYELEVDGMLVEVESFDAGYMKLPHAGDAICKIGDLIAKIVLDEINPCFKTLPLYLSGIEIASMDAARGDTPREVFIRDSILKCIAAPRNSSE